jgi:hypothetical protein
VIALAFLSVKLQEREEKKEAEKRRRIEKEERRKNPITKIEKGSKWDLSNEEMYKDVDPKPKPKRISTTDARFKIGDKVYFYYRKDKKAFPVKITSVSITGKFFKYGLKELTGDAHGRINEIG